AARAMDSCDASRRSWSLERSLELTGCDRGSAGRPRRAGARSAPAIDLPRADLLERGHAEAEPALDLIGAVEALRKRVVGQAREVKDPGDARVQRPGQPRQQARDRGRQMADARRDARRARIDLA